jgi:hypothetical protein
VSCYCPLLPHINTVKRFKGKKKKKERMKERRERDMARVLLHKANMNRD